LEEEFGASKLRRGPAVVAYPRPRATLPELISGPLRPSPVSKTPTARAWRSLRSKRNPVSPELPLMWGCSAARGDSRALATWRHPPCHGPTVAPACTEARSRFDDAATSHVLPGGRRPLFAGSRRALR